MGCKWTKKNESNVNLEEETLKNPQLNNTIEDHTELVNINFVYLNKNR